MIILDSKRREGQEGAQAFQGNVVSRPSVVSTKQIDDKKAVKDEKEQAKGKSHSAEATRDKEEKSSPAKTTEVKEEVKADDIPF